MFIPLISAIYCSLRYVDGQDCPQVLLGNPDNVVQGGDLALLIETARDDLWALEEALGVAICPSCQEHFKVEEVYDILGGLRGAER